VKSWLGLLEKREKMIRYEVKDLLKKVGSKYGLVIVAAKRARQINDYFNSVKRQEIPHVVPPQVELEEAIQGKPISIALREILEDKIEITEEEELPA